MIKVGDKYIVEIGAIAELPDGKKKYFIKPFESLAFDRKGLDLLTKYDDTGAYNDGYTNGFSNGYEDGKADAAYDTEPIDELKEAEYNKGYEDGLKNQDTVQYTKGYNSAIDDYNMMFKFMFHNMKAFRQFLLDSEYYENEMHILNSTSNLLFDIINDFDIAEVIDKFKKWQEKKEQTEEEPIRVGDEVQFGDGKKGVIISICYEWYRIVFDDGIVNSFKRTNFEKTGRNFSNEVSQLLDKLRGEK